MKRLPKLINELGPDDLPEELPKHVEEAFGKIEVVIESKETSRIFYFLATRNGCKIEIRWSGLIAGITAIVTLVAGIRKLWS
jgi:hypothetical protein